MQEQEIEIKIAPDPVPVEEPANQIVETKIDPIPVEELAIEDPNPIDKSNIQIPDKVKKLNPPNFNNVHYKKKLTTRRAANKRARASRRKNRH